MFLLGVQRLLIITTGLPKIRYGFPYENYIYSGFFRSQKLYL